MPNGGDTPLHVLSYMQNKIWVCHCLEFDLRGRSYASQEAAFLNMKQVIEEFFVRTRGLARRKKGASSDLWEAWNKAADDLPTECDHPGPSVASN